MANKRGSIELPPAPPTPVNSFPYPETTTPSNKRYTERNPNYEISNTSDRPRLSSAGVWQGSASIFNEDIYRPDSPSSDDKASDYLPSTCSKRQNILTSNHLEKKFKRPASPRIKDTIEKLKESSSSFQSQCRDINMLSELSTTNTRSGLALDNFDDTATSKGSLTASYVQNYDWSKLDDESSLGASLSRSKIANYDWSKLDDEDSVSSFSTNMSLATMLERETRKREKRGLPTDLNFIRKEREEAERKDAQRRAERSRKQQQERAYELEAESKRLHAQREANEALRVEDQRLALIEEDRKRELQRQRDAEREIQHRENRRLLELKRDRERMELMDLQLNDMRERFDAPVVRYGGPLTGPRLSDSQLNSHINDLYSREFIKPPLSETAPLESHNNGLDFRTSVNNGYDRVTGQHTRRSTSQDPHYRTLDFKYDDESTKFLGRKASGAPIKSAMKRSLSSGPPMSRTTMPTKSRLMGDSYGIDREYLYEHKPTSAELYRNPLYTESHLRQAAKMLHRGQPVCNRQVNHEEQSKMKVVQNVPRHNYSLQAKRDMPIEKFVPTFKQSSNVEAQPEFYEDYTDDNSYERSPYDASETWQGNTCIQAFVWGSLGASIIACIALVILMGCKKI